MNENTAVTMPNSGLVAPSRQTRPYHSVVTPRHHPHSFVDTSGYFNDPASSNTAETDLRDDTPTKASTITEAPRQTQPVTVETSSPSIQSHSGDWAPVWRALGWLGMKVIMIAGMVALTFTAVFSLVRVSDDAMGPALAAGDTVIVYRFVPDYALGDVVALDYQGQRQLRRVVARGGDTVDITSDGLEVNGSIQYEPRITSETLAITGGITLPVTLGEDEIFVLADDRESSGTDSRFYGPIKTADTLGKTITLVRRTAI